MKWHVRIGPSKLATLHLCYDFIDPFVLFFDNHVFIGAKIMQHLKLLISWVVRNMGGKTLYVLLIF